jgi:adenosylcobinamide-GDP ribazoletransferase
MHDAWRLAFGTFTALPVGQPRRVDEHVLGGAMLLAPATAAPAAVVWLGLGWLCAVGPLPPAVAGVLALVVTALASRAFHLDGLADLADGLTSGHDPDRSLAVMRRGDTGPAGAAALVLVLLLDAACLAGLFGSPSGTALAVVGLLASRLGCAICARRGIPAARPEGLGQGVAGTVSRAGVAALVTALAVAAAAIGALLGPARAGVTWGAAALGFALVVGAAAGAALAVRHHAVRRLGGITGDVIGAAIEISLAAALVTATVVTHTPR